MATKITVNRKKLFDELWETDAFVLCEKYNISLETLSEACERYNIPMPHENYLSERKKGEHIIPKLEPHETEEFELPTVRKHRSFVDSRFGSKANSLCVLITLEDLGDMNKPLSVKDIINYIDKNFQLKIDRRTVYSAIDLLIDLGYDIDVTKEGGKNYYSLNDRQFEPSEVKIILDSICLNPLVNRKKADSICNKVNKFWGTRNNSEWFWSEESIYTYIYKKPDFTKDENLYYILDVLDASRTQSKKIRFDYMKYNADGELVSYRDEKYILAPDQLYINNNTYYLSGVENGSKDIVTFRVDRMRNVTLTDENYNIGGCRETNTVIGSYIGKSQYDYVKIKCDYDILEKVSDDFSEHLTALKFEKNEKDNTFTFSTFADIKFMAHWAAGVANKCEVVEPKLLRDMVIDILKNNKYGV